MPIVAPTHPLFPYQEEPDIAGRTYRVSDSDVDQPPPKIKVTIDPAVLARALRPDWPEAMRHEEV